MEMNCGSAVAEECVGLTIPYTDAGFQKFVGDAVAAATGAINIGLSMMAEEMTENMVAGLNALRCAVVSGGYSVWYFFAAAWWALYAFEQQVLLEDLLDEYYPHVCTCKADVDGIAEMFGASEETTAKFGSCSEAADNVNM